MIPYGKQDIDQDDITEVVNVLKSDFLTQGPKILEFEDSISRYVGSRFTVAVNSATSALHLGCLALGVEKKDLVWTSSNSFVASSNAALYCGAEIDFVDIDSRNNNMCTEALEKKLVTAKKKGMIPKVVIPVHLGGLSCDMKKIFDLSKDFGFKIIEDASHCIGGDFDDEKIGSCKYSDLCVFSFHPVKIITTGEGGAITTNSQTLAKKITALRSHGITRNKEEFKKCFVPDWYYQQHFLGFNYRITDLQAALGISQLKRIDSFIKKRRKIAKYFTENLNADFKTITTEEIKISSNHLFIIKNNRRDELREYLLKHEIFTTLHYFPIHLQPFYASMGFKLGDFPNTEKYGDEALSIPIHTNLNEHDVNYIVEVVNKF
ncbi:MAG: UDP-4-amino-4,6-dideoxy-N-acetyl-beta-L-altrosamine transaminase [SAR86 cluster bacterium]|nr:UDP-4-amino-4,6-dideoxy-N-acetyl-beta-L-altrosamine transaminase [SAR86 cluster bacterium]